MLAQFWKRVFWFAVDVPLWLGYGELAKVMLLRYLGAPITMFVIAPPLKNHFKSIISRLQVPLEFFLIMRARNS